MKRRKNSFASAAVLLVSAAVVISLVDSVDHSNFKTCEQSSFCRRCRKMEAGKSAYELDLDTLKTSESDLQVHLVNTENSVRFILKVTPLVDNTVRVQVEEESPLRPRFVTPLALVREPELSKWQVLSKDDQAVEMQYKDFKIKLIAAPFKLEVWQDQDIRISMNPRGLFRFEHTRKKPEQPDEGEDPGSWEENFKSHHDSKPHGPTAIASDFTFYGARAAYGLPEHADSFALKTTTNGDPYRFYNLDVFEYEMESVMALYAAIPYMIAHSEHATNGLFWLNPSETWVDVVSVSDNVVSSIVNFVGGGQKPQVDVHFMSESGNVDVFLNLGPSPYDVFRQYTALTGTAPVPPIFSLGYHQSRWNYNDEGDVDSVNKAFDEHDLPMDAIWLDIEHTDNKRYFTWDPVKFPNPIEMQQNLTARGRKLVAIVDPHIKRDPGYFLHNDATSNGYYVKNKDNNDFEGWCWPGSSSYLDFMNPAATEYYSSRYKLSNYIGSTEDLHLWNDMNEPSVFNGPEVTMHKDNLHFGGWEHRELHNIYGILQVAATYDGLVRRNDNIHSHENTKRPFILTRSGFAGSQRFGAIWTGDNAADWAHMRASVPMCLSLAVAGFSFCGADVGGFFNNPDREMFIRWYQTGAFLPFYRAHSHIDTKRREPWVFDQEVVSAVRDTLRLRYSLVPLWYTLFYEYNQTGSPVIRPLWADYPADANTFAINDQLMVGSSLIVKPVMTPDTSSISIYFPGSDSIWYDLDNYKLYKSGWSQVSVTLTKIPVYYRGGAIVPRKLRIRRSVTLMANDPYTLVIALDQNGKAEGHLYMDDGVTHRYKFRKDSSAYMKYSFSNNVLTSDFANENRFESPSWIERIIIVGLEPGSYKITAQTGKGETSLSGKYEAEARTLTIRKPGFPAASKWQITIHQ